MGKAHAKKLTEGHALAYLKYVAIIASCDSRQLCMIV